MVRSTGGTTGDKKRDEETEEEEEEQAGEEPADRWRPGSRFSRRRRDILDMMLPGFDGEFAKMRELMDRALQEGVGKSFERPFVYGFSMRIGPDGKPQVQEFGHRPSTAARAVMGRESLGDSPREPLTDVIEEQKQVVVTYEMPGVDKKDVELEVGDRSITVKVETDLRKFYKETQLPCDVKPDSAKASCANGILEITIEKRKAGAGRKKVTVE